MQFKDILNQVKRPYWSPMHPLHYVRHTRLTSGKIVRGGWGMAYPEDIGYFNLIWLLSGVGGPPDNYQRYAQLGLLILSMQHDSLGRHSVKDTAALRPLSFFSQAVIAARNPNHEQLLDAVRLRV